MVVLLSLHTPSGHQSLALHGVDPYTYLVDVLQRAGRHPARERTRRVDRLSRAGLYEYLCEDDNPMFATVVPVICGLGGCGRARLAQSDAFIVSFSCSHARER